MPVESAADRAALFNRDEFAEAALYTPPGGSPVACTIIYDRERDDDKPFEIGTGSNSGMRGALARQRAMITIDDVPVVVQGAQLVPGTIAKGVGGGADVFVPGPDTLKVASRPRLDETGAIWTVDLQKL